MTSGFPWTAWLFWIGGAVLALSGVALFYWAMFKDRARGRKRCPKCWYDLGGIAAAPGTSFPITCSECGRVIKRERKLYKTRRRKRWAFAALLGILAAGWLSLMPKVDRDGWWSIVSNRMLIAGLPFAHDIDDFWCKEMARRVELGTGIRNPRFTSRFGQPDARLSRDEWRVFFARCVAGDWFARPTSPRWQQKYGELIHVWTRGSFQIPSQDALAEEKILLQLPPVIRMEIRDRWPEDTPLVFQVRYDQWWPYQTGRRVHVKPQIAGAAEVTAFGNGELLIVDPVQTAGIHEFVFDVSLEWKPPGGSTVFEEGWESLGTRAIRVPVTIETKATQLMQPTSDPRIAAAFTGGPTVCLSRRRRNGNVFVSPVLDMRPVSPQLFRGVGFGIVAEFMQGNEVVASTSYWWPGGMKDDINWGSDFSGDLDRLKQSQEDGTWTVRIRGDPEVALRVEDCQRFWQGEVTIPLHIEDN